MYSAKIKYCQDILTQLSAQKHRVESAKLKRNNMITAATQAKMYPGLEYRSKFLVESADLLGEFLEEMVETFNTQHRDDLVLNHDVGDVLELLRQRFNLNK